MKGRMEAGRREMEERKYVYRGEERMNERGRDLLTKKKNEWKNVSKRKGV